MVITTCMAIIPRAPKVQRTAIKPRTTIMTYVTIVQRTAIIQRIAIVQRTATHTSLPSIHYCHPYDVDYDLHIDSRKRLSERQQSRRSALKGGLRPP